MTVASREPVVTDQGFPPDSAVYNDAVNSAWYRDSFAATCRFESDPPSSFFAVFGHHPGWVKALLLARNRVAGWFGLAVPDAETIRHPQKRSVYAVGELIGPWPIFSLNERELVAGRNNRHLDFRVSLLRTSEGPDQRLAISTLCVTHNLAGKAYLLLIIPFHRWGVRAALGNAVRAGRV
jgi:Protein of unknown function (DUF2867)